MAKTSKATKKFQKKNLKHTIEHRNEVKKHNKKIAGRRGAGKGKGNGATDAPQKKSTKPVFDDMSVEDFFEGGFEVPKPKKGVNVDDDGSGPEIMPDSDSQSDADEEAMDLVASAGNNAASLAEEEESSDEEDAETMKREMEELQNKDPEFYKYLQKNDKQLLDFEAVNPLDAMDEADSDADESEDDEQSAKKPKEREVTRAWLESWDKSLTSKPTLTTLQNVIAAFKSVILPADEAKSKKSAYVVNEPSVLADLVHVALKNVPEAIQKIAPYKVNLKGLRKLDSRNSQIKVILRLLRGQLTAYISLLEDINNTETAALVLSSVQELLPYYVEKQSSFKKIIQAVANVWSSTSESEIQIATYAFMNNAAREFDASILETVLRAAYSAMLKNCRKTNVHNMDSINFCKNSLAELFGIDEQLSYKVGFEFVRQLAVHLRNSMTSTTGGSAGNKDAFKTIYNWQYCHSLDFWSRVLSQHCNPEKELVLHKSHESPLRSLIYPLVQVTLGTIKLIPTAQFFPLRFYLVRSLIRLSQGSGVFIPIYPLIAEILTSLIFSKRPKNVQLVAVDFDHNIKVSQQYLGTRIYQDGLCDQFLDLVGEYLVLYSKSVAFPELATPVILSLRRFVKKSKNSRFNKQIQQLVEKLVANANYITTKRSNVEYGPSNKAEVQAFLKDEKWESTPLGQFVVVHRKTREQRAKLLKEAAREQQDEDEEAETMKALQSGSESEDPLDLEESDDMDEE